MEIFKWLLTYTKLWKSRNLDNHILIRKVEIQMIIFLLCYFEFSKKHILSYNNSLDQIFATQS